jgi:predicted transcriptional regulator
LSLHDIELEITDEMRQLGISGIHVLGKTLVVHNTGREPICCQYYKNDLFRTIGRLRKALNGSGEFDKETVEKFLAPPPQVWLASLEAEAEEAKTVTQEKNQRENIREEIRQMKDDNAGISNDDWISKLNDKYQKLRGVVDRNIPELWPGLEFELSVLRILNIAGCTLPFIGIILGRPSSSKTAIISLLRRWYCTYYSDNFTAKAFVSHSTAVASRERLTEIDMLPKIKDKLFLTPELSPMFSAKDDDLIQILGIITRIADGQGLMTDSGVYGQRGYDGKLMFTWVGAGVDIPHKVYKHLGNLGAKLYFFRMSYNSKTEDDLVRLANKDFDTNFGEIKSALFDYLKWFEIGPDLIEDKSSGLPKMKWDKSKDDLETMKFIVRLAMLLSHLRCVAKTWETENTQGSQYAYSISLAEDPSRAATLLTNLAKGRALLEGRNYVTKADVPIVIKTVLSTAQIERVSIFSLLLANGGSLTTSQITDYLNVSKQTALRTMAEIKAVGLVEEDDIDPEKRVTLRHEFDWFLSKEFAELSEDFKPVDYSVFLKEKDNDQRKEKSPPHTTNFSHDNVCQENSQLTITNSSRSKIEDFQKIYDELEAEQLHSPESTISIDKSTVGGEELRQRLLDSNLFSQSDAAIIIQDMVKAGYLEEVSFDTYVKKKQWSRKSNEGEDNSKKER